MSIIDFLKEAKNYSIIGWLRYAVWLILMIGVGLGIGFGLNKFEEWTFDLIVGY